MPGSGNAAGRGSPGGGLQVSGKTVRLKGRSGQAAEAAKDHYFCVIETAPAEGQCGLISGLLRVRPASRSLRRSFVAGVTR